MCQVYPIIADSVRVERRRVYDNDDRQTDKYNDILLLEMADLEPSLYNIHQVT